jgi:ligand-binding sensor domain-containing protein/AraC-like DNA-binding protein
MWIGTMEGLSRYDGNDFLSFPNAYSLKGRPITFIDQITKNQLLLGTTKGNFLFSMGNNQCAPLLFSEEKNSPITVLFRIQNKRFIGSQSGIYEYDRQKQTAHKVSDQAITCMQKNPTNGKILLGTENSGIYEANLEKGRLSLSSIYPEVEKEKVVSIQFRDNNKPAILTTKGLWLPGEKGLQLEIPGNYSSLSISQQNEILLGTIGEFIQQVYQEKNLLRTRDYINRNNAVFNDYYDAQVNVLFRDHSGSIWIGTNRAGLDKIDRKKITYQKYKSTSQVPEAGYVNALTQSKDGKIWVGTSGKGLNLLNRENNELVPVRVSNGKDLYIEALLQHQDQIYIGTRYHGIITANYPKQNFGNLKTTGKLFSTKAGLGKNDYIYALKLFQNQLYICSAKGTFSYDFESKEMQRIDSASSINIEIDSLQNRWILSWSMKLACNGKNIDLNTEVSDLLLSKNNKVWAATSKGLALIQDKKVTFFNPPEKVIEFTSIQKDQQGQFWLGSRMGIYKFNPATKIFASYQIPGGSKANSFNHGKILCTPKGEFFWGSNDGVVSIAPSADAFLPQPKFVVEKVPNGLTSIFNVRNLSYNHLKENGITYRFSHPDSSWHLLAGNQSPLDFSHLNKGSYQINITAINADGIRNEAFKSVSFDIKGTSKTNAGWWILVLILVPGVLFLIYQRRKTPHQVETKEEEESTQPQETPEDRIYREWSRDEFMQKAISIIEEQLSNNAFGVKELYAEMQMSKSNFYRKLKTITDLSPNELIRFIRLRKSTQLLIEAKLSVNEIAYEVGFNTPSYFTRCFKQQFGIAPSEFKEHYDSLCIFSE